MLYAYNIDNTAYYIVNKAWFFIDVIYLLFIWTIKAHVKIYFKVALISMNYINAYVTVFL